MIHVERDVCQYNYLEGLGAGATTPQDKKDFETTIVSTASV